MSDETRADEIDAACRCQIIGWSRDLYEPHIPSQPEWEQADDCPRHPLSPARITTAPAAS